MGEVTKVTATKRLLLTVSVTIIHNEHGQQSLVLLRFPLKVEPMLLTTFQPFYFPLKAATFLWYT